MFLSVKELSSYLAIKSSTLYSWAAKGVLPHYKVHGLLRFKKEEIDSWVASFKCEKNLFVIPSFDKKGQRDIDFIIASAKKEVYNIPHGKPGPIKVSGRRSDGTL
jgi:excisionase family DNA binding protein